MRLEFSKENQTQPVTLEATSEVFTNCDTIHVTRIVCGERFTNYRTINNDTSATLPAGEYEFKISQSSCNNGDCWACIEDAVLKVTADALPTVQMVCAIATTGFPVRVTALAHIEDGAVVALTDLDGADISADFVIDNNCC